MKKHVISFFTKVPQPGNTKTRLTVKHDGVLSEQEAVEFYRAMMLDVAEAAFQALELCRYEAKVSGSKDEYFFFISCTPENDLPVLKSIFETEFPDMKDIHYMVDSGSNFDEHFNDHYRQLFGWGYDSVVCIGGDLPTISPGFIHRSFQWLSYLEDGSNQGALVMAPCQAAGVSLVGLTANAPMDFKGVFYNDQGTSALDAIVSIASARQIPTAMMETQSDVDTMEDLAHLIALLNAMTHTVRYQPDVCIPQRTLEWIAGKGLTVRTPPNSGHDPRGEIDD